MKSLFLVRVVAAVLLSMMTEMPALGQGAVPFTAVVASIEWRDVGAKDRAAILARIGVGRGDVLSIEARQRMGRELGKNLVFSYKPGAEPGTAILVISADC